MAIPNEPLNKSQSSFEPSFWRMPESSKTNCLLDAGFHQHDGKDTL